MRLNESKRKGTCVRIKEGLNLRIERISLIRSSETELDGGDQITKSLGEVGCPLLQ